MHTARGIFELKYFFGSHVTTEAGGSASSTAIRALIKQLVAAENGHKPLSDGQISEILAQQGLVVARRTVAKYRETLQILPVNLRKTI
jgi:RNA polymerase sigma-54 factor